MVKQLEITSKFYPSRRSSKMIAAMKTNRTHTYTHTQSQIRHTQRKREKMTESYYNLSGVALNPTKFVEDRPKDLGEVGEQTEKKHDQQKKNINLTFDLDDL